MSTAASVSVPSSWSELENSTRVPSSDAALYPTWVVVPSEISVVVGPDRS